MSVQMGEQEEYFGQKVHQKDCDHGPLWLNSLYEQMMLSFNVLIWWSSHIMQRAQHQSNRVRIFFGRHSRMLATRETINKSRHRMPKTSDWVFQQDLRRKGWPNQHWNSYKIKMWRSLSEPAETQTWFSKEHLCDNRRRSVDIFCPN